MQPVGRRDGVLYIVDIRSFHDSNGDGVGDFRGLIQKLDYIADLGVTTLVLLPFQASAGRSGGFDIVDHRVPDPATGTMRDVRQLVRSAHQRGLRVLADFVAGYTSDQHLWFQRAALRDARAADRAFYLWQPHDPSAEPPDAAAWTWERRAGAYHRHAGAPHEPVLDLQNERVVKSLVMAMQHWLRSGLDGLRVHVPTLLDTTGQPIADARPPDAAWWTALRSRIAERHPDAVLVADVDGWPDDLRTPFGDGAACTLSVNRALPLRIVLAMQLGDRLPITDIVAATPAIPAGCQWTLLLRDQSGLSLAGLTVEERDYLAKQVAPHPRDRHGLTIRRRLAPLLDGDPARIRLALSLLFTMPGFPGLLYGDEIEMGDNPYLPGFEGLRSPMQWTADRNGGFSTAEPATLLRPASMDSKYGYGVTSVSVQLANPASLQWWIRRMIALRGRFPALDRGSLEFVPVAGRRQLAYVRRSGDDVVLCVANFSRFAEQAELDLSTWHNMRPVELWSRSHYPVIGTRPYALNLPPCGFAWFQLVGAVLFRTCFISYSSADHEFATRLYDDLRSREVTCWMAARDLTAGEAFRESIAERVRRSDRVIVICSDNAFRSREVEREVTMALAEEKRRAATASSTDDAVVLIPLRIDDAFRLTDVGWFTELRDTRHVADFEQWSDSGAYDRAFRQLIRELAKTDPAASIMES